MKILFQLLYLFCYWLCIFIFLYWYVINNFYQNRHATSFFISITKTMAGTEDLKLAQISLIIHKLVRVWCVPSSTAGVAFRPYGAFLKATLLPQNSGFESLSNKNLITSSFASYAVLPTRLKVLITVTWLESYCAHAKSLLYMTNIFYFLKKVFKCWWSSEIFAQSDGSEVI